jgi:hypothetical protein
MRHYTDLDLSELYRPPDLSEVRIRRLNWLRRMRSILRRRTARRKATTSCICRSNSIIAVTAIRNDIEPTPTGDGRDVTQNDDWFSELSHNLVGNPPR